jgi:hypothetical protein
MLLVNNDEEQFVIRTGLQRLRRQQLPESEITSVGVFQFW